MDFAARVMYLCRIKISDMNTTILHKAETRGHADHGWLVSHQSFSFAGYYNPARIGFGVLRVLNDDIVAGGRGFGSHPHDNMEIISIPLEGSLVHEDNLGHKQVVSQGEIQVMSTGTGVFHSEYNNSPDKPAKFLQIWIFPNQLNVKPRYDQMKLDPTKEHNRLRQILSPDPNDEGVWIYQDAWFHTGRFDADREFTYRIKKPGNGAYLFVINGSFTVDGQPLEARDGIGITGTEPINLLSLENGATILIMDVPMQNKI
jgi:quercetin 2,3-dioxygenase